MKTYFDCIPCFIKQSLEASRMVTDDITVHEKVVKEVMNHFQTISFEQSPPEISRDVHEIIRKITNSKDPYKKVKNQSNNRAKRQYAHLKTLIEKTDDPLTMYLQDIYTLSVNLAGLPALSIPCGFSQTDLPIGMQFIGPVFSEEILLRVARIFEKSTGITNLDPFSHRGS